MAPSPEMGTPRFAAIAYAMQGDLEQASLFSIAHPNLFAADDHTPQSPLYQLRARSAFARYVRTGAGAEISSPSDPRSAGPSSRSNDLLPPAHAVKTPLYAQWLSGSPRNLGRGAPSLEESFEGVAKAIELRPGRGPARWGPSLQKEQDRLAALSLLAAFEGEGKPALQAVMYDWASVELMHDEQHGNDRGEEGHDGAGMGRERQRDVLGALMRGFGPCRKTPPSSVAVVDVGELFFHLHEGVLARFLLQAKEAGCAYLVARSDPSVTVNTPSRWLGERIPRNLPFLLPDPAFVYQQAAFFKL